MPRACAVCGSRRWHKDKVTGNAMCDEGHVYRDFRSENLVTEPGGPHALQKRTLKKGPRRNKRRELGRVNPHFYHGNDAEWLKMQAIQHLLRLQAQALKKLWSLPDVFEARSSRSLSLTCSPLQIIVRDIWAYQLAMSPPLSPPWSESSSSSQRADSQGLDPQLVSGQASDQDMAVNGSETESLADQSDSGSSRGERSDPDVDAELLAMLSEGDGSDKEEDHLREVSPGAEEVVWRRKRRIRVSDTISTLALALWILRWPISFVQLERLVNDNRVPYLDYGHTTLLPEGMAKHVNQDVMAALCPARSPRPQAIFDECRKVAKVLNRHFGVVVPPLNAPPVIWGTVSSLGGSPTTYAQVNHLLALVDLNLSLVDRAISEVKRRGRSRSRSRHSTHGDRSPSRPSRPASPAGTGYEKTTRYQDVFMPELAVAAAWVITMKMAYGLDGQQRLVVTRNDPTIGAPDGDTWISELDQRFKASSLTGQNPALEKRDFIEDAEDDIDRYLDLSQDVLLSHHDALRVAEVFPLPELSGTEAEASPSWDRFHSTVSRVKPSPAPLPSSNRSLPLLPGERIRSYSAADVTGTLPPPYAKVVQAAAAVAGVTEEDVNKVVEVFERRLEKVRRGRSRSGSESRDGRGHITAESLSRRRSSGVTSRG